MKEGLIMTIPAWQYLFSMSLYMVILYGFHEMSRKYIKGATLFFLLTLFTFPLWIQNLDGWFRIGKTLIVLIPINFVNIVRLSFQRKEHGWESLRKNWVLWVFYLILSLNIVEASIKDLSLGNYFNTISGFILCLTIPLPQKAWCVGTEKDDYYDLIADLPFAWSLLYTTWNAAFVYAENPGYLASSICILTVPIIRSFYKKRYDLWMSARAYTLGLHIFIRATYDVFTPIMDSSAWSNDRAVYIWSLINLVLHAGYLIMWLISFYKKKTSKRKMNYV